MLQQYRTRRFVPTDQQQFALRLSPSQDAHLEERAAFWGCSKAAYLRRLVQEDLIHQQQGGAAGQG